MQLLLRISALMLLGAALCGPSAVAGNSGVTTHSPGLRLQAFTWLGALGGAPVGPDGGARAVAFMPDGGVVVAGGFLPPNAGIYDPPQFGLARWNRKGRLLWQQLLGTAGTGTAIAVLPDGSILAAGVAGNGKKSITAGKWTPGGSPVWLQTVATAYPIGPPPSQVITPAGDVVVAGSAQVRDDFGEAAAFKLSGADGHLIWDTRISYTDYPSDSARGIALAASGDVLIAGDVSAYDNATYRVVKLDGSTGTVKWATSATSGGTGGGIYANRVVTDANGDAYAVGALYGGRGMEYTVTKMDRDTGELLWHTALSPLVPGESSTDEATDLAVGPDGTLLTAGLVGTIDGGRGFAVAKLSPADGSVIWRRNFTDLQLPGQWLTSVPRLAVDAEGSTELTWTHPLGQYDTRALLAKFRSDGTLAGVHGTPLSSTPGSPPYPDPTFVAAVAAGPGGEVAIAGGAAVPGGSLVAVVSPGSPPARLAVFPGRLTFAPVPGGTIRHQVREILLRNQGPYPIAGEIVVSSYLGIVPRGVHPGTGLPPTSQPFDLAPGKSALFDISLDGDPSNAILDAAIQSNEPAAPIRTIPIAIGGR